jgi:hypothetical protein
MAWGELKKEDLVKAGLDPDSFKSMSDKIATAASKADVDEIKGTLTTTQETLKNLEATLRNLSAGGGQDSPRNQDQNNSDNNQNNNSQNNRGQNNGPQGPVKIDPLEFMENPTDSVRRIMGEAITPLTLHSLNIAAEMSYNMARQRLPHFEKFEPEIKELWNKYTPGQKQKPDELIENLYNLVRGRHMDEIMTDTNKKEGKYNMIQSGGSSIVSRPGGETSGRKPEDDLTPKELEVAARFGLTPKEWAEQKQGLKYV